MVMTTSDARTASWVRCLGCWSAMLMPTSRIASTATGLIWSAGSDPADLTSIASPARWVSQPAAIWERPALWTHTNSTVGLSDMAVLSVSGGDLNGEVGGLRVEDADEQ